MVENRRREFVTASCAREALARLGHPPTPIRSGPMRELQWPSRGVGHRHGRTRDAEAIAIAHHPIIQIVPCRRAIVARWVSC